MVAFGQDMETASATIETSSSAAGLRAPGIAMTSGGASVGTVRRCGLRCRPGGRTRAGRRGSCPEGEGAADGTLDGRAPDGDCAPFGAGAPGTGGAPDGGPLGSRRGSCWPPGGSAAGRRCGSGSGTSLALPTPTYVSRAVSGLIGLPVSHRHWLSVPVLFRAEHAVINRNQRGLLLCREPLICADG